MTRVTVCPSTGSELPLTEIWQNVDACVTAFPPQVIREAEPSNQTIATSKKRDTSAGCRAGTIHASWPAAGTGPPDALLAAIRAHDSEVGEQKAESAL